MPIRVHSDVIGKDKGPRWKKLTAKFYKNVTLTAQSAKIRNEILKKQKGLITNLGGFLDALADAGSSALLAPADHNLPGAQMTKLSQAAGGELLMESISAKYAHVQKAVQELSKEAGLSTKYEIDHVNITPLNTKITALIEVVESLKEDVSRGKDTNRSKALGQRLASMAISGTGDKYGIVRELDTRLKHLRTARAYLKELEGVIRSGQTPTEMDLGRLVYKNSTDNSYWIKSDKINDVNVYEEGGMLGSFQIIEEGVHDKKTEYQDNMSFVLNYILTGKWKLPILTDERERQVLDLLKSIEGHPTRIVGSEGIENSINRQLVEIFKGKKPKPSKSKTTSGKKINPRVDLRKTKAALAKLKSKKKRAKQLLILAAKREIAKRGIGKTSSGQAKAALHLKRKINQRLPAEVRRNMGRPALINRTGQFSNSVKLMSLRSTAGGFAGDYSYTLTGGGTSKNKKGVYATFENKGVRRWPGGYNPKLLITKSIRKLAQQYTEQKFTKLRRI